MTISVSKASPPMPPSSSRMAIPVRPRRANSFHVSREKPSGVAPRARRLSNAYSLPRKRRIVSCRRRRSSARLKSMSFPERSLEAQDHLRDDVLLDLVGSAVDRGLAHVEVVAGERRGIVLADRIAFPPRVERLGNVGQAVGAQRLHLQLRERLLDLAPANLEDGSLGPGGAAGVLFGEHAQVRDLERHELDLDLRD